LERGQLNSFMKMSAQSSSDVASLSDWRIHEEQDCTVLLTYDADHCNQLVVQTRTADSIDKTRLDCTLHVHTDTYLGVLTVQLSSLLALCGVLL
jgi:hypothetical protein